MRLAVRKGTEKIEFLLPIRGNMTARLSKSFLGEHKPR
jgi:hypothetical protein